MSSNVIDSASSIAFILSCSLRVTASNTIRITLFIAISILSIFLLFLKWLSKKNSSQSSHFLPNLSFSITSATLFNNRGLICSESVSFSPRLFIVMYSSSPCVVFSTSKYQKNTLFKTLSLVKFNNLSLSHNSSIMSRADIIDRMVTSPLYVLLYHFCCFICLDETDLDTRRFFRKESVLLRTL